MRKITRNAIVATVSTVAVIAVAFPVFSRAMGKLQNEGSGWEPTHASQLPSADAPVEEDPGGVPVEAAIGESFIVGEQLEVTVNGIACQKEKGPLPELSQDWADYYGVILDTNGTIQNDFVYVIVEATFKNVSDSADAGEIRLNQSCLAQDVDGDVSPVAEVVLCDSVDLNAQVSNAGEYDLADGESITTHLGYVVPQDALSDSGSPLYFLPDFTGASLYDPASVNAHWVKVPAFEG
ncbi:hypothetical protein [Collinsella stercoris]|uniref:DUF4352 domain-containing protein n=1 Tax=Collinsella stercoris DSM 13279 TaxID=445975 RepID=B6GB21_9ACTN|nr:hypothetical protein [Collinsella stercoris]EEA90515.1 hypothetical protein COLSTE_01274 [Collinsella stercoris DSM 13279]UEA45614.1 hypothetical protein LK434_00435 [Collinsella stercoris DSM 13279]UWP11862.1 hypothetical protein NQ498_01105 [Collinsella stercoris]